MKAKMIHVLKWSSLYLFIFLLSNLIYIPQSYAKNFKNAYVSFDLPDNWKCHLEDTEWICRSSNAKAAKQAIIILTAKEVGPTDQLSQYEAYLKQPKAIADSKGKPVTSKVKHVKQNQVNNHIWIDSLHLSSEVSGYYTRYLATTKGKIAILVTFSAHQRFYTNYTHQFFKAIASLKVVATNAIFSKPDLAPLHSAGEQLGAGLVNAFPEDMYEEDEYEEEGEFASDDSTTTYFAIFILIAALGGYFYLKSRQKKS